MIASPLYVRLHAGNDGRPCAAFRTGFCLLRGSFPVQHPLHKLCDCAVPVGLQLRALAVGRQIAVEQALLPEDGSQELQSVCAERRSLSFLQRELQRCHAL